MIEVVYGSKENTVYKHKVAWGMKYWYKIVLTLINLGILIILTGDKGVEGGNHIF